MNIQILNLALTIFLCSGFYHLGKKICQISKLNDVIGKVSNLSLQYTSIGIVSFLMVLYPFFFLEIYSKLFFSTVSYILVIFGLFNILVNFKNNLKILKICHEEIKKIELKNYLVLILIALYFLLSISPVTSGDSVSYHLGAAKYILQNGHFSKDLFNTEYALVGSGEFLNTFAVSIGANQFTSLINFVGITSVLGIILKFSFYNKLNNKLKNYLYLCLLSCPVLIFLTSSSKSQLFATSIIFLAYAILVYCLMYPQKKEFLTKSSYLIVLLPIAAIQTKLSFSVSFFIIVTIFFFSFFEKLSKKKFILTFILLFFFELLPQTFWKQAVYNYPFYNFLLNPFPINIPGYNEVYLDVKNYNKEKFPFILLFPTQLKDLTQFLGFGIISTYFVFKSRFKNKKTILTIIVFFIFIYSIFGQKASRFYIEIYFFVLLILTLVINEFQNKNIFKFLNISIILQSIFTMALLLYGVFTLLPGSFSNQLYKDILSKNASGYNLYNWANTVLPRQSSTLIKHRSYYFAERDMIYVGMTGFFKYSSPKEKIFFLNQIKKKKPNYILFYGNEEHYNYDQFDFINCTKGLFKKKDKVGYNETRNPFYSSKQYYNAYIYKFDYSKMPGCVKFD